MDPAALDDLGLFIWRADELGSTRLLRNGAPLNWTINYDRLRGVRFTSTEPHPDDLRSFLTVLRHFLLEKEPTHIAKVYNLCEKHIASEELRGYLRDARKQWKQTQRQSGIKLVLDDREWQPEYVADLWLNGWYFHNDPQKRAALQRLMPHEGMLVRHVFIATMFEAARAVVHLANVIRAALREGFVR
jgi:hypothetical protein